MLDSNSTSSSVIQGKVAAEDSLKDFADCKPDFAQHYVLRRNGKRSPFDQNKIVLAMSKAFLAVEGEQASASNRVHQVVEKLVTQVVDALFRRLPEQGMLHIEDIQDQVELALMRAGEQKVARAYVLYREQHAAKRQLESDKKQPAEKQAFKINIKLKDNQVKTLTHSDIIHSIEAASLGIKDVDTEKLVQMTLESLFDGMTLNAFNQAMVLTARSLIESEPNYSKVAARLLLNNLWIEALSIITPEVSTFDHAEKKKQYPIYFKRYIKKAVELKLLDTKLAEFDLQKLANAIDADSDHLFNYLGLQTLYDRYFLHAEDSKRELKRIELPQAFFMRVAMGLAIHEIDREAKAIEFYRLLSSFDFMCSTPTLFNSGTLRPQLSSCYLTTVADDLAEIYSSYRDNALLSKFAGGLGNDWTRVRGMGANIVGTNGKSQGVIPFLKVANDTAVAVNQGGKRKGAVCAYLETWHIDIEDFLELRKNTGDERRRTHDMNTANWVPDLFMQRVIEEGEWSLFSPEEVAELHELTGEKFKIAYENYEQAGLRGELKSFKQLKAVDLWRKMLSMLFETGHPWITFKDPCNIRYTNQHCGVVHSSNLCTEITLHTNDAEVAVCNLGSINLPQHLKAGELDKSKLEKTINTAMRMLDNVIDYNYYSIPQARKSNLTHRPVGLGLMGFNDALYQKSIAYASDEAVNFADQSMELISYFAIKASSLLAKERGQYLSYQGSLWSEGTLPIDSIEKLAKYRGEHLTQDNSSRLDWQPVRDLITRYGMRNSNCLAIAPTATISNICGVSQSIEPTYQNLFVKSNLSGEFTVVNQYLVKQLKQLNLWDPVMVNDLKYFDGSVQNIDRIPARLKQIFATAFEIDPNWLIEAASRRQKWLDQAQSLNIYLAEASGKKLDKLYKFAWSSGLKTTYYLRSLGATQVEKTQSTSTDTNNRVCSITDPDCDACQ